MEAAVRYLKRPPKLSKEWLRGPALDILLANNAITEGDRVWECHPVQGYAGPAELSRHQVEYCVREWARGGSWKLYAWRRPNAKT